MSWHYRKWIRPLGLQRFSPHTKTMHTARHRWLRYVVLYFGVLAGLPLVFNGCAGRELHARATVPRWSRLMLSCVGAEATVFIDDRFVGQSVASRPLIVELRAGEHRLEVRRDRSFAAYRLLQLRPGSMLHLCLSLQRIPYSFRSQQLSTSGRHG